jgi:hypothetical protein
MSWLDTLLTYAALAALVGVAEFQRRRLIALERRLAQAEINQGVSVGIHTTHREYMEELRLRLDHHARAINYIGAQPTCPQALGARIGRIEMMLLPQTWDTPTGQPTKVTRGGKS